MRVAAILLALLAVAAGVAQTADPLATAAASGFEVPTPEGWEVQEEDPVLRLTRTEPEGTVHATAVRAADVEDAVLAALRAFVDPAIAPEVAQAPAQQSPASLPSGTWTQRIYLHGEDVVAVLNLQRDDTVYLLVARGTQTAFAQSLNAAVTQMLLGFRIVGAGDAGGSAAAADAAPDPDPEAPGDPRFTVEAATLRVPAGTLHGTLLVPADVADPPVALIVAGSGPTDRDGNSPLIAGRNDSLRLLAEELARRGIASLRYDKRGVGESAGTLGSEADLVFGDFVDDAAAWLEQLAEDERFGARVAIGHSEGSLIGMLAAERAGADAFVSIAGAGRNAAELLLTQLAAQLPAPLLEEATGILASLQSGESVAEVSPELASLFRPSVQPYLMSWIGIEPTEAIARLGVPVLIVQGTSDIQVAEAEAELLAAAAPDAQLVIVEDMNHILKRVPAGQDPLASYGDPTLPLAEGLVDAVAGFLEGATGAR